MTDYQQYERLFVGYLGVAPARDASTPMAAAPLLPSLQALLDAMPYYTSPQWHAAHRGALVNLLEANLPNSPIVAQPVENGFGSSTSYGYYPKNYSGYQNAFFTNVTQTPAAAAVAVQVQRVNISMDSYWWGRYGVTVLTDAARRVVGLGLDAQSLSANLSWYDTVLLPALSATCLAVFTSGYAPTADAYQAIV